MIKAIIFDIGEVLVGKVRKPLLDELIKKYKLNEEDFKKFETAIFEKVLLGQMKEEEYYLHLITKFNLPISVLELQKKAIALTKPIKETWKIVENLKGKYILAILSDMGEQSAKIREDKFKISKTFNYVIYSFSVGVRKPNPRIYQHLLKLIKIPANECLFIEDKQKNIDEAKRQGMKTILFKNAKQLKKELVSYKIGVI